MREAQEDHAAAEAERAQQEDQAAAGPSQEYQLKCPHCDQEAKTYVAMVLA